MGFGIGYGGSSGGSSTTNAADLTEGVLADARVQESNVTQHQAALSITESQISDLGNYQPLDSDLTSIASLSVASDRILFWDQSAGGYRHLEASTGLTLSGTTLTVRSASETVTGISERATVAETLTGTDTSRHVTPAGVKAVADTKVGSLTTGEPSGSDTVTNIVSLTQAEYDAGTPVAGTFYVIVG